MQLERLDAVKTHQPANRGGSVLHADIARPHVSVGNRLLKLHLPMAPLSPHRQAEASDSCSSWGKRAEAIV